MPNAAHATYVDGNRLYQLCSAQDTGSQAICGGYILGVIEALRFDEDTEGLEPFACIDEDVTLPQLEGNVLDFLDDHPDENRQLGASLVAQALSDAYPCGD